MNTDRLFWLGRYSERVYTTLRLFSLSFDTLIEQSADDHRVFCESLEIPDIYRDKDDFIDRYAFGLDDPNSIISNLYRAYDNAIELREEIGSETLSFIQMVIYEMKSAKRSEAPLLHFQKITDAILAFWGCADDQIASGLANQYDTIYYVDMLNDHYIEFSSTDVYKSLDVRPSGDDFFSEALLNIDRVIHSEDREAIHPILEKSSMLQMLQEKHMITHTYRILIEGGFMYARLSIIWATDNRHLIIGVMNIDKEMRREQEIVKRLYAANEKAYRDDLTGVKSKAAFTENAEELQTQIARGTAEPFAIVVCDVNGLKHINDTYGHKAGDEHIIKASKMICDIFQHSPVYRTGGDEFVAILTDRDYLIRRELLLALHDRSVEHISADEVVISGGLSEYKPGEDTGFQDVFERADALMYEEKQLLKGMGAVRRDDAAASAMAAFEVDESPDILRLKRHILIVDDEKINQIILGNMLGDGFDLVYASDGIEALEQIKKHRDELALVLLDLLMPGRSCLQMCVKPILRRSGRQPGKQA